eukprot:1161846-Pelagomonas_calceolata.AAC.10
MPAWRHLQVVQVQLCAPTLTLRHLPGRAWVCVLARKRGAILPSYSITMARSSHIATIQSS